MTLPRRSSFGVLDDGHEVTRYVVGDPEGVHLAVIDLGAAVQALWVPGGEGPVGPVDVVLGGADLATYTKQPPDFFGAVIGRVGNRIADAELTLDGRTHALVANDGPHTLHGGPGAFHARLWDVVDHTDDAITLALTSDDGDQGFPGRLRATATYRVDADGVDVELVAEAEETTVAALTHHAHFCLAGEQAGSVLDHELTVRAGRFTPVDDGLIPTGELASLDGSPLDLRATRRVGEAVGASGGLDHNYVLDGDGFREAAVLRDPASGRTLTLLTDQPGLQVYAGGFFDGSVVGPGGTPYGAGAGLALEPQAFPDAVHHRGEPGWPDVVVPAGGRAVTRLRWAFSTT